MFSVCTKYFNNLNTVFWNKANKTYLSDPREISKRLVAIFNRSSEYVAKFEQQVHTNTAERVRLYFSTFTFPAVAINVESQIRKSTNFENINTACDLYLNSVADKDRVVLLKDYLIWEPEHSAIMGLIQQNPLLFKDFSPMTGTISYGSLLGLAYAIRKNEYFRDTQYGFSQLKDTKNTTETILTLSKFRAMTLARQVFQITAHEIITDSEKEVKLQKAVACGSQIILAMWFSICDVLAGKDIF